VGSIARRRWVRAAVATVAAGSVTWIAFGMHTEVPGLDQFDLAVHETGHLLAAFTPRMVMVLAGSAAQVLFPLAMAAYFGLRRDDVAAAGFCLAWAGESARDVSVYAGDAVRQALPLIGGGEHDWAYILGPNGFDALGHTATVARSIEFAGLAMAVIGIAMALVPVLTSGRGEPAGFPAPGVAPEVIDAAVGPGRPSGSDPVDPWIAAAALPFHHEPRGD
jgi:hypothetical protein